MTLYKKKTNENPVKKNQQEEVTLFLFQFLTFWV